METKARSDMLESLERLIHVGKELRSSVLESDAALFEPHLDEDTSTETCGSRGDLDSLIAFANFEALSREIWDILLDVEAVIFEQRSGLLDRLVRTNTMHSRQFDAVSDANA